MGAAQNAIETSVGGDDHHIHRSWVEDSPSDAVASPALALQAAVASAYTVATLAPAPETEIRKWPGWVRGIVLLGAAAGAWALMIGLAVLVFPRL
jgi:hypothetical protein